MSQYEDDMKFYDQIVYKLLSESIWSGPIVGTRIFPVVIEQDVEMPAIAFTYEVIPVNTKRVYNLMEDVIYNFYCFHNDYEGCMRVTQSIRDTLDRNGQYAGATGYTTQQWSLVGIDHATYDKDRNLFMIPVIIKAQVQREFNI